MSAQHLLSCVTELVAEENTAINVNRDVPPTTSDTNCIITDPAESILLYVAYQVVFSMFLPIIDIKFHF